MMSFRIEITQFQPVYQSRSNLDCRYGFICEDCKEKPASVLIQRKTIAEERTLCEMCWGRIKERYPDIMDYYDVYPINR